MCFQMFLIRISPLATIYSSSYGLIDSIRYRIASEVGDSEDDIQTGVVSLDSDDASEIVPEAKP